MPLFSRTLTVLKKLYKILISNQVNNAKTYFPEIGIRKSRHRIILDQIKNLMQYHDINWFYYLYGFDRIGFRQMDEYVDNTIFMRTRDLLNRESLNSLIPVLRNKYLFGIFASSLGFYTPQNIGFVNKQQLYLFKEKKYIDCLQFIKKNDLDVFLKKIDGECADGVYNLTSQNSHIYLNSVPYDDNAILQLLHNSCFIIQERITQCEQIRKLHPSSINTIRIETVLNKQQNKIEILPPLLRVGTGNHNVDNWAAGGLAITIDLEHECLGKYGYYKPEYGTKTDHHPDSGIVFQGYKIPFLSEAISQVIKLHSFLYNIHSIGWDIAITETGLCIIEGNDNWEISLVQICSHGLKREFEEYFK